MKQQAFNPYLPSWEYIPDGEPYVFDDRIYVYGSHDSFGAPIFCVNDYVCWSAPINDLSDWRYEGIIYRKKQDPCNKLGLRSLYAPDLAKGADGRYYLYYALDFMGRMGVAVCNTPAGQYEFYGYVHFEDGHIWGTKSGEPFPFDPGILVDDNGKIYLYSGFAVKVPFVASRGHNLTNEGGVVLQLKQDMLTIKEGPILLFPIKGKAGAFKNHAFFEASSIRKVGSQYCFVYSSEHNHDLCYALSDSPMGPFTFEGRLIDIGDLGLAGNEDEKHASNYLGNTHGGLLEVCGKWYVFYHRQTNRSSYARQACAEKIELTADGKFCQAEVTSCGLNDGPLRGLGKYDARIACNLWSSQGTGRYDCRAPKKRFKNHPYFTQSGKDRESNGDQYIANMRDGAVAGYKYFDMGEANRIQIDIGGKAKGTVQVADNKDFITNCAEISICISENKRMTFSSNLKMGKGKKAVYFRYRGSGYINFYAFGFEKGE
ncbi:MULTISPECIES: family 43 glycosylhydrolase [Hungatella]|uniref:Family 43 glycosylhydrolase n=1 Tax=Hungatella hathewayi TaxID=154046 RepID=A0AAW9WM77_9FIRM|nr:family 43 glycosylhydrolase [Hungatella hathewayi]MCQ4830348.1 family 43 glycosylhydrolase [Hungatella sp. SL.1.14]MUB66465.1 family 43 glycosylhydrolase [Hungatella hathewayi]CUQ52428.1 beta-xylosidase [Hungatella hathewayi]